MITTFTFVRHGETDWNRKGVVQGCSDIPLNTFGIQQAYAKASFFADKQYDIAYSSPLVRACETMQIILAENNFNLPVQTDEKLVERNFGEAEGIHFKYHHALKALGTPIKDYETNEQLEKRLRSFLFAKIADHAGKSLLITAHSHVLKAACRAIKTEAIDYLTSLPNLSVVTIIFNHQANTWAIPYIEGVTKH